VIISLIHALMSPYANETSDRYGTYNRPFQERLLRCLPELQGTQQDMFLINPA